MSSYCYAKNVLVKLNMKFLILKPKKSSKGTLGSYLNRGMPNRIIKSFEKTIIKMYAFKKR
jgi:hypothetical protein